jgi:hypothetical protein
VFARRFAYRSRNAHTKETDERYQCDVRSKQNLRHGGAKPAVGENLKTAKSDVGDNQNQNSDDDGDHTWPLPTKSNRQKPHEHGVDRWKNH